MCIKNLHVKRIESEILQAGMTRLRKPQPSDLLSELEGDRTD